MKFRSIGPLLCGGLLLLAVLTPVSAPAGPVNFSCSPTKVRGSASAKDGSVTTSHLFANIPEASVAFTQGGASPSCVLVRFSAATFAGGANNVVVRAFLDGNIVALPTELQYSGYDANVVLARTFEFVFPSVAPGPHALHMQFRSLANGSSSYIHRHNVVVQYAP
jgi:hypothetical protein